MSIDTSNMEYYLVGGAVRDHLLKLEGNDKDYCVINETRESMYKRGFVDVSGDCIVPVFKDKETGDEYSLARTEHSTGIGHNEFKFNTSGVGLIEDLTRRDFTINAMAMHADSSDGGRVIDPANGQEDIIAGVVRHISPEHFMDDPLRILRAARFAARFDFVIAKETINLCRKNTESILALPQERITKELFKAIDQVPQISLYFRHLLDIGALEFAYPEVYKMINVPQIEKWHPEGDVFNHTMMVIDIIQKGCRVAMESEEFIRDSVIAGLFHDIGKTLTKAYEYPTHHNHCDDKAVELVSIICDRMRLPKVTKQLCTLSVKHHMKHSKIDNMSAGKVVKLLRGFKVKHGDSSMFNKYLSVCSGDKAGRGCLGDERELPFAMKNMTDTVKWCRVYHVLSEHRFKPREDREYDTKALQQMALQDEVRVVKSTIKEFK